MKPTGPTGPSGQIGKPVTGPHGPVDKVRNDANHYELLALREVAAAAIAIERIGTFSNHSVAQTSPCLTAALDKWRSLPQCPDDPRFDDGYASDEIFCLREAAKAAHEAWTCDPDAASTRSS